MPKGQWEPYTEEQKQFIRDNYLRLPVKAIASETFSSFGRVSRFLKKEGLEIPEFIVEERRRLSRYTKGQAPFNKGKSQKEYLSPEAIAKSKKKCFKKGNVPHNTLQDGAISIRKSNGRAYKFIRIAVGKWKLYQQYVWEKHHGKIPRGHCLWFKDGDSLNCKIENLELITRSENINRNSLKKYPEKYRESVKIIRKIRKELNNKNDNGR